MKKLLTALLAILLFVAHSQAAPAPTPSKPRNITGKDGTIYRNATILGSNSRMVMIACDQGSISVSIDNMPDDIQKELGYMGPGAKEKAEAEKAAQEKAAAEKAEQDKKAKLESSKHEILPGTEKKPYPQLNPDFFPDELATQISAYNSKALFNNLMSEGKPDADTAATIAANAKKLTALHAIYLEYKAYMQNPPADIDAAAARKAVASGDYRPYGGMPEIALQAIMGAPDKVETHTSPDKTTTVKSYYYGASKFDFQNGKYIDAAHPAAM